MSITTRSGKGSTLTYAEMDGNLNLLQSQLNKALFLEPLKVGFAGDSIAAFWAGTSGQSVLNWAVTEIYPCDIVRMMDTSLGGTSSSHLLTNQLPVLQALTTMPDLVIVQSLQNDFMGTAANAIAFAGNVTSYATAALAAGVKMVAICARPPKTSVLDTALALAQCNRILEVFCRTTPGCYFVDVFGAWRANGAAGDTGVLYRGTANAADAFSNDGTHPTGLACRAAAPYIVPVLQQMARPIAPFTSVAVAYDNAGYPFGNVLGRNGFMNGTSGAYNGTTNAGVAGVSTGAQDRWFLVDGSGIVATPSIVTGADGFLYQQLIFSGTASADVSVTFTTNYIQDVASGTFIAEAIVEAVGLSGINTIQLGFGPNQAVSLGDFTNTPLTFTNARLHFRSIPGVWSNSGFANKSNQISFSVKSGQVAAGTVRIGRVGVHRIA